MVQGVRPNSWLAGHDMRHVLKGLKCMNVRGKLHVPQTTDFIKKDDATSFKTKSSVLDILQPYDILVN